jgi:hypothetical protein
MAYSWRRNNSVDLNVLCLSPPKYKNKPWTDWGEKCCGAKKFKDRLWKASDKECCGDDNDCVDELGDVEIVNDLPLRRHENYEILQAPLYIPSKIQDNSDKNVHHNSYMPFIIALSVLCLCGITVAGIMWCSLIYIRSKRIAPSHSDVEVCDL